MSSKKKIESLTLKPSDVAEAIRAIVPTGRSLFVWGPPGISKSQTAQQVATDAGIAFVDFRLSQLDPTDLRGIPYPTKLGGREGVRWSVPYALPVDLDLDYVAKIDHATDTPIAIANPKGSNDIHYCTNPHIKVTALGEGLSARIVKKYEVNDEGQTLYYDEEGNVSTDANKGKPVEIKPLDKVYVQLEDKDGKVTTGKVRLQVTGKVKCILGLEEFNSAPPSVQAAAYQFVLDRRLGEYVVPAGVAILAMGNRDTDKGVTFKMPTPVMNRFVHIEMRHDFDDWQIWALKNKVHPDVVGYLSAFKPDLFQFDAGTAARGFATPRSWEFVSDILNENGDLPPMVNLGLISGAIGDGIGVKFVEFRDSARDLPHAEEILSGRLKKLDKSIEVSAQYALTTSLCYELLERFKKFERKAKWGDSEDYKKWMVEADNFILFLMQNFQPEISIMATRAAVQVHRLPFHMQKMKNFVTFADKYRNLVMG